MLLLSYREYLESKQSSYPFSFRKSRHFFKLGAWHTVRTRARLLRFFRSEGSEANISARAEVHRVMAKKIAAPLSWLKFQPGLTFTM